jgi:hypothetical protein
MGERVESWTGTEVEAWEHAFETMAAEEDALRAAGRWTRGPHDLLAIIGRRRSELTHNRMLAWFLDPAAAHGLGVAPLQALLELLDVDAPAPETLGRAYVQREVRSEARGKRTIADLLVDTEDLRVVFEIKVDAHEQDLQGDRLVEAFDDNGETVFVFLTLDGRSPWTGVAHDDRWLALTWRQVLEMMRKLTMERPPSGDAAAAIAAYLDSLQRIVR